MRIRPPCRVDEEEAGEDGREPEACVRKTAANSIAIQGQDFTFDAVADAVSTQVRVCFGVVSLSFGILCAQYGLAEFWSYFSEERIYNTCIALQLKFRGNVYACGFI